MRKGHCNLHLKCPNILYCVYCFMFLYSLSPSKMSQYHMLSILFHVSVISFYLHLKCPNIPYYAYCLMSWEPPPTGLSPGQCWNTRVRIWGFRSNNIKHVPWISLETDDRRCTLDHYSSPGYKGRCTHSGPWTWL